MQNYWQESKVLLGRNPEKLKEPESKYARETLAAMIVCLATREGFDFMPCREFEDLPSYSAKSPTLYFSLRAMPDHQEKKIYYEYSARDGKNFRTWMEERNLVCDGAYILQIADSKEPTSVVIVPADNKSMLHNLKIVHDAIEKLPPTLREEIVARVPKPKKLSRGLQGEFYDAIRTMRTYLREEHGFVAKDADILIGALSAYDFHVSSLMKAMKQEEQKTQELQKMFTHLELEPDEVLTKLKSKKTFSNLAKICFFARNMEGIFSPELAANLANQMQEEDALRKDIVRKIVEERGPHPDKEPQSPKTRFLRKKDPENNPKQR